MNSPLHFAFLAACLVSGLSAAAPKTRPFTETVLQPLPGSHVVSPTTLNDLGDVAGFSGTATASPRAVLWRRGTTQAQTLADLPRTERSEVLQLNNHGSAVGISVDADRVVHAVMWNRGVVHELPPLPGETSARAGSLNDRGQAVGSSGLHATLWDVRGVHDLGIPAGAVASEALGINPRGDILLVAYVNDGSAFGITRHFVLRRGKLLPTNLPVDRHFIPSGISANATVVGNFDDADTPIFQAWSSQHGQARQLPSLPGDRDSRNIVISSNGKMVGLSGTNGSLFRMVAWDAGGVKLLASQLPSNPAAAIGEPLAVNNRSQILCSGFDGVKSVGVLLTP